MSAEPRHAPPEPLSIVAVGDVDAELLRRLGAEVDARLGTRSRLGARWRLREAWHATARGQYDSDAILDALITSEDAGWTLGVTTVDLFAPTRPWIFGVATQAGCCALVSTARLHSHGADDATLFRRLVIETVHELGHVLGLVHCEARDCVMSPSATLAAVDAKGPEFCARCRSTASFGC